MIYGYCRVSTKSQKNDGNSLEVQEKTLREHGASKIYKEAYTGAVIARPELDILLNEITEGDTLIVTKIDRIARSLSQGSELITELIDRGIKVNILNLGIMDNTPSSKLARHMLFAFAEFEKDMIRERTQEGKAMAKSKPGFREGRPKKFTKEQLNHALGLLERGSSYKQVADMTRISKSTLYRETLSRKNEV